jgi:hypothetical protein
VTKAREPRPILPSGSLTRDPEGRLITVLTNSDRLTPIDAQALWSQLKQHPSPARWDGRQPTEGRVVRWTGPIAFACAQCGRGLGEFVAYRFGRESGIVRDVAKASSAQTKHYCLSGEVGGSASNTSARFKCGCGYEAVRNAGRLGRALFNSGSMQLVV